MRHDGCEAPVILSEADALIQYAATFSADALLHTSVFGVICDSRTTDNLSERRTANGSIAPVQHVQQARAC